MGEVLQVMGVYGQGARVRHLEWDPMLSAFAPRESEGVCGMWMRRRALHEASRTPTSGVCLHTHSWQVLVSPSGVRAPMGWAGKRRVATRSWLNAEAS